MKKNAIILSAVCLVLLGIYLSSCATIMTGTKQYITINCNVENAIIKLDGREIGITPFRGQVPKNGKILTIQKDGYKPYRIAMSTTLEPMFWGNIITGGTLGSSTDLGSGAAYKYSPASFQVDLISDKTSMNEFKEYYELRKFAMVNMSNIAIDLSNNTGDYLETILFLTKLENNGKSIEEIRQRLIKSDGDQVRFGNLMVELLDVKS